MLMTSARNLARTARLFHALADETRLRIVESLCEGEQCVCELTTLLKTSQSLLSFHLKTLKEAGMVQDRREGRWIYYTLQAEAFDEIKDALDAFGHSHRGIRARAARCR